MALDSKGRYIFGRKGTNIFLIVIFCIIILISIYPLTQGRITDAIEVFVLGLFYPLYFYAIFYQSYAYFNGNVFHIVRIFFMRNTIPVMSVQRLSHRHTFGGVFHGIQVVYKSNNGSLKRTMIPISAFGTKNVSDILKKFVQMNPMIHVDSASEKLMRKYP